MSLYRMCSSAGAAVVITLISGVPALAACPEIKATANRGPIPHAVILNTVKQKHGGDWSPYIAKWERRIDTAREVAMRGKGLVVRIASKTKTLRGEGLLAYIDGLADRVDVIFCLKAEVAPTVGADAAKSGDADKGRDFTELADCATCHGFDGIARDRAMPNLAGQDEVFLRNQIKALEADLSVTSTPTGSGLRRHKAMQDETTALSADMANDIAAFYAGLACDPMGDLVDAGAAKSVATPRHAEICSACHGKAGRSRRAGVPSLAGQNVGYLFRQLRAFRMTTGDAARFRFDSQRHHQFMSALAGPLTNAQMRQMATYFAERSCR